MYKVLISFGAASMRITEFAAWGITAVFIATSAQAQTTQTPQTTQPPPLWSGNFGAGLAATNGNTDTKNVNLSMAVVRDPKRRSVLRFNGLYLRGHLISRVHRRVCLLGVVATISE